MEQPAVHAVTPPPDVLSPSLVASAVASPVTVEVDADGTGAGGEAEAEDDTGADAWLTGTDLPDLPAESAPPSTLSASVSAGASASTAAPAPAPTPAVAPAPPTPVDDLLPLPTSFDPDAPPPALAPVEIDDELAIKPKEADDADGIEAVEDPVAEVAEAVELPDMSGWIQDIQDLQDYGAADEVMAEPSAEAEAEAEARPPEPIEMSPLAELPQQLEDVPSLPALSESSSAAQARAANGNGTAAAAGEKRKGGALAGAESKRGKKSTQPRQLVDEDLGVVREIPKPQERTHPRAKTMTDQRLREAVKGRAAELQAQPCIRGRYSRWGKCVQCIAKVGGDSCRFRDYRQFPLDPDTSEIVGRGIFPSTKFEGSKTPLPRVFNTTLTDKHISRTERTIAPMLLSLITQEMRHVLNNPTFLTRPVDTAQHRAVCDFCAGTIFSGFWFCTKCGRDYCLMCERYISDTVEKLLESPWPVPDKSRARLQRCSRGEDSELPIDESFKVRTGTVKHNHSRQHLQPVSRFTADEVVSNWTALVEFVLQPGEDVDVEERLKYLGIREDESELAGVVREWFESHKDKTATAQRSPVRISETELEALYDASKGLQQEPDPANLGSLPFMFVSGDRLDNDLFDHLWSRGEPLVVDGLAKRFLLDWTPNSFIRRFGPEPCFVVDCQTEMIESMLIGQFFTLLKDPTKAAVYTPPPVLSAPCREATRRAAPVKENGDVNMDVEEDEDGTSKEPQKVEQILKLKDWPATNDFSDAYPDLYDDFCRGLPVPDYTARNGVMNLYSHFPKGATRPDIGPKMYNAFAGKETAGGQGSTRMHMDVADAVNIMLYASPMADGSPGCAVWDLFRAEDADAIRDFLTTKYAAKAKFFTDPIHSQMFYLDAALRQELFEHKGVKSFRVYQYPGQAVFIPAGCAHQVCNLAGCIKIALDFVSPHNVGRCQKLTQDFRRENFTKAWKDDVLQLYNVMWYAWTNVRETRERRENEAAKAEAAQAARSAHLASLASGGPDMYPHSALRLRTTQTSSVRDDPAPSPSPAPGTATPERGDKEDRGAEPDVPPHSLVDRLKAAALVRELQPVHIEGVEPHHLQQQHLATPPNAKPEPERRRSARHR